MPITHRLWQLPASLPQVSSILYRTPTTTNNIKCSYRRNTSFHMWNNTGKREQNHCFEYVQAVTPGFIMPSGLNVWIMKMHFLVCHRSEYVGESELPTTSAWYQQQLCGYRYSGAFLCPHIHRLWLLSLQTKVSAWKGLSRVLPWNFSWGKEHVLVSTLLPHLPLFIIVIQEMCTALLTFEGAAWFMETVAASVVWLVRCSEIVKQFSIATRTAQNNSV